MSGYTAAAKLVALAGEIVLKIHQRIRDARAIRLIQSRADLLQEFLLRKRIRGDLCLNRKWRLGQRLLNRVKFLEVTNARSLRQICRAIGQVRYQHRPSVVHNCMAGGKPLTLEEVDGRVDHQIPLPSNSISSGN